MGNAAERLSTISDGAYESILVQGGMGRGKSSAFVLPNLLSPPGSRPSFVISDTSGELYQASSGYLAAQGYVIRVLNLMTPARSETYNPLANATAPQDLAELAKTLVRSASGRAAGQPTARPEPSVEPKPCDILRRRRGNPHGRTAPLLQRQSRLGPPSRACKHALPVNGQVPEFATFHRPTAPPHARAEPHNAPRHPAISPRKRDPSTV